MLRTKVPSNIVDIKEGFNPLAVFDGEEKDPSYTNSPGTSANDAESSGVGIDVEAPFSTSDLYKIFKLKRSERVC